MIAEKTFEYTVETGNGHEFDAVIRYMTEYDEYPISYNPISEHITYERVYSYVITDIIGQSGKSVVWAIKESCIKYIEDHVIEMIEREAAL